MSEKFINFLNLLVQTDQLTSETTNNLIGVNYPGYNFGKSKVLLRPLCKHEMESINSSSLKNALSLMNLIFPKLYVNKLTLDNYYSSIRRVIFNRWPNDNQGKNSEEYISSKKLLALDWESKKSIIQEAKDKVNNKTENVQDIELSTITTLIKKLVSSDKPIKRAFALILASGCRPYELFYLSKFKDAGDNWITQDKLAKKGGKTVGVLKPLVELSPSRFIEEVDRLRADMESMYGSVINDSGQLISKLSTEGNIIAKQELGDLSGATFYSAKSLYGIASYEIYGKVPNILGKKFSSGRWGQYVFGHDNLLGNYSHWSIK